MLEEWDKCLHNHYMHHMQPIRKHFQKDQHMNNNNENLKFGNIELK